MKYIQFGWVTLLFCLLATGISGCRHRESPEIITKDASGIYHIDGKMESLDLEMADGGIVFSRENAFSVGVAYTGTDFFWSDDNKDFYLSYQGKMCFDFNRDLLFDFLYEKQKYYIRFDGRFIEVKKPDFQAMQAVDINGRKYHWNGSNWLKQK